MTSRLSLDRSIHTGGASEEPQLPPRASRVCACSRHLPSGMNLVLSSLLPELLYRHCWRPPNALSMAMGHGGAPRSSFVPSQS